jgi:hypothetical protein
MQTFGILRELLKYHYHTYGLIMGGANRATEAQKLAKGKIFTSYTFWGAKSGSLKIQFIYL